MAWEQFITTWVQSLYQWGGSAMDGIFLCLTFLAEDAFLLVAVFAVYWCLDKRMGEYLLLSLFASLMANSILKDIVRRPRPFLAEGYQARYVGVDNGLVNTLSLEHSFSFPSGHSQCAGSIYTALALWLRRWWGWLLAVVLILCVMASRVYLGVHYPADVLVGAVLGITASLVCWWLFQRFYEKRLLLFGLVILLALPALFINPTTDTVKAMGVGIGGVLGLWFEMRFVSFTTQVSPGKKLLRLGLGGGVIMLVRGLLKVVFPQTLLFDGIRYGLVGLCATGALPWAFKKYEF